MWYKIWGIWHCSICHHTGYRLTKEGLTFRKEWYWKALHNIQLPICSWLDDKAHN